MKCRQCGMILDPKASFCGKCGTLVDASESNNNQETQFGDSRYARLCVLMGFLLLVFLCVIYFIEPLTLGYRHDDTDILYAVSCYMLETAVALIALSYKQLMLRSTQKKSGILKVNIATKFAGFFAFACGCSACLAVIDWIFSYPYIYPFVLYIAFAVYVVGCLMTIISGAVTLFVSGNRKKKKLRIKIVRE